MKPVGINSSFVLDLFNALEKQNDSSVPCSAPLIGVTSYGVSMTTLEEVFLKLDEEQNDEEGEEMGESLNGSTEHLVLDDGLEPKEHLSSSSVEVDVPEMKETSCGLNRFQLQWQQFVALMEVRNFSDPFPAISSGESMNCNLALNTSFIKNWIKL